VAESVTLAPAPLRGSWRWQLLATGTPTGGTSGPLEVRAWQLTRDCPAGGRCRIRLARQLVVPGAPNETSDRALLEPLDMGAGSIEYSARFPAVATRCIDRAGATARATATSASDRFTLSWAPGTGSLSASEVSRYRCGRVAYSSSYSWNAAAVPRARVPRLVADPRHAASRMAFLRAAASVCRRIDARALPIARGVAADERVLRAGSSRAAKARAEADIARGLAPLGSLSAAEYSAIPQPPAGPLDALWLRDVRRTRARLAPSAAMLAALADAARAAGAFYRSGSSPKRERARAEAFLAATDAAALRGSARASTAIERKGLSLPATCVRRSAIESILSAPPVPITT
jgi:hypothetical protein